MLRKTMVELVKTKDLLRSKIFFLWMDELVEKQLTYCIVCQTVPKNTVPPPIQSIEIPEIIWKTVNMDYLGHLPDGKCAPAMIDQWYPIVEFTTSTNAINIKKTFTHFKLTLMPWKPSVRQWSTIKSNEIKIKTWRSAE